MAFQLKNMKIGESIVIAHPTIKEIDSAKLLLFYDDHNPPHIHVLDTNGEEVVYDLKANQIAPIGIKDTKLIARSKLKKIKDWIKSHKTEIEEQWQNAINRRPVTKIK